LGHPFLPQIRGDAAFSSEDFQTTMASVGVVRTNDSFQETPGASWLSHVTSNPSCVLFGDSLTTPFGTISNLPDDSIENLAFLCDALVVVISSNNNESDTEQILSAIIKGINRRDLDYLGKGQIIIVSPSANETSWVQRLVQKKLSDMSTSSLFQKFDVVSMENFEGQWQNMLTDSNIVANLFPEKDNTKAFVKLLQNVCTSTNSAVVNNEFQFNPLIISKEEELPKISKLSSPNDTRHQKNSGENIQDILATAQSQCADLERKLEQVMLDETNIQMPPLEFGTLANNILDQANKRIHGFAPSFRRDILTNIVSELQRLYKEQLQLLRNYYGKRYESTLDQEEDENEWAAVAKHATQGYQAAAGHAVPKLCQSGRELDGVADFDTIGTLNGLLNDMMEATEIRKEQQGVELEEEDSSFRLRILNSFPPWVRKVAAKAFVLGVNYIQGWLAWQGLKRAALERDRNMPKFPLF
jgi:hypothetical protein